MEQPKRLQIVFLATGAFAVPAMQALLDSNEFEIVCLVTNPPRYDKSGNMIQTPARQFATKNGIAISEKEDVHSREFRDFLYLMRPDLLFVCDFGHILSKNVLKASLLGGINLHGSLLPKYRGAAPVHWAILSGETFSGVSVIHMTPQVDAGPVILQSPPIPIGPKETLPELEDRLAMFGAELVLEAARRMARKEPVKIIEQVRGKTSKAPRLKKENGFIDWSWTARAIFNHYRAMIEWPKSFSHWVRQDTGAKKLMFLGEMIPLDDQQNNLLEVNFTDPVYVPPILVDAKMDNLASLKKNETEKWQNVVTHELPVRRDGIIPGTVIQAEGDRLVIAAGQGLVRILQIQPAGKRMLPIEDFLRGYHVKPGDRFER